MEDEREAVIVVVGDGERVTVMDEKNDRRITRNEVKDALSKMKTGEALTLDGCHRECMVKGTM